MKRPTLLTISLLVFSISFGSLVAAENDKPTNEEIAKELANPNTALTSLKFQFQYFSFDGDLPRADDQDMLKVFFQPTLPFPLDNGKTVWVRPGVPFVFDQPVFDEGTMRIGEDSGLGDMTLDVQYGTTLEDGFLWSVGFSSLFPTTSKDKLGSGQWTLAPGFQVGRIKDLALRRKVAIVHLISQRLQRL